MKSFVSIIDFLGPSTGYVLPLSLNAYILISSVLQENLGRFIIICAEELNYDALVFYSAIQLAGLHPLR